MRKRVLKKIAILAAPIIWRRIRGRRRHRWSRHGHHHWYHRSHHRGHGRRGVWL
jgi:hypothetical protein